jgi:hypothetical protein
MSESIPRFPLEWPLGWKRVLPSARQRAGFSTKASADGRLSVLKATERLQGQLDLLGGRNSVLSTNVSLRLDGRPRSDEEPGDPGAALYFQFRGKATVLACDKWTRVADNIAALAAHIDAIRRVDRYGVGTLEQALAGYKALPADSAADWRSVFGLAKDGPVSIGDVDSAYKQMARTAHPDVGGDEAAMAHLNRARDYAYLELVQ